MRARERQGVREGGSGRWKGEGEGERARKRKRERSYICLISLKKTGVKQRFTADGFPRL